MSELSNDSLTQEETKQDDVGEEKEDTESLSVVPPADSWQEDESLSTTENQGAVISSPSAKPFVTMDRKNELLLQARVSRLAWIQSAPLPYRTASDLAVQEDDRYLSILKSTHAIHKLPSVANVLSNLYGIDESSHVLESEISDRVESVIHSVGNVQSDRDLAILSGTQVLEEQLSAPLIAKDQVDLLKAYQQFVAKLETPECASLVQGMRNFAFKLAFSTADELASSLRSYADTTFEAIKAHVAWKENGADVAVQHALESFLYGHCQEKILSTLTVEAESENEFLERLNSLQFLTPSHLEIHCIREDDSMDDLLEGPISALRSVDSYFSPYEKLQRILKVFHGVNTALKVALNRDSGSNNKLPSADDVLPTLILTVLRAKPPRLLTNLRMIELYSPPAYLRGEAGYAYTNLYGAVQFLRDLKMDGPDTLSIDAEEFRKGLESCRAAAEAQLKTTTRLVSLPEQTPSQIPLEIPVGDVRAARLRGEAVDLDWALKRQAEQLESAELPPPGESSGQESMQPLEALPTGFSRSYSFLTSRPEDIRVSDLPQLLAEYRMLVHTTEQLLAEQTKRTTKERKDRVSKERQALIERAVEIDPTLLRRAKRKNAY